MSDKFWNGLSEILHLSPVTMRPETELNEDNWDSMVMISAIALIDEVYDITVPVEKLARCRNVGELAGLVGAVLPGNAYPTS